MSQNQNKCIIFSISSLKSKILIILWIIWKAFALLEAGSCIKFIRMWLGMTLVTLGMWCLIRSTPVSFSRKSASIYLCRESETSREQEATSESEKTVCGWVEKCCMSAHTQRVDTNICSICCPCQYSTHSTVTERCHATTCAGLNRGGVCPAWLAI